MSLPALAEAAKPLLYDTGKIYLREDQEIREACLPRPRPEDEAAELGLEAC